MEEIMGSQMYWSGWTKEGGGVKTLPPSPIPRISPNRQYAPYFVTKARSDIQMREKKEEKQSLGLKWNANKRCSQMGVIK